jgi:hypothetical protein
MELSIKKFKSYINLFNKLKAFPAEGAVEFESDWQKVNHGKPFPYDNAYTMKIHKLKFKTLQAAWSYSKVAQINTNGLELGNLFANKNNSGTPGHKFYDSLKYGESEKKGTAKKINKANGPELAKRFKTMRFIPKDMPDTIRTPYVIQNSPLEVMEGNHTYRIVTTAHTNNKILVIGRDDDAIYDYLDKGFFILGFSNTSLSGKEERYIVITNELDIHTMHIYLLASLHPKLCTMLKNNSFVHSTEAQMMRLKMEKKLPPKLRGKYDELRGFIEKDYQNNTSLLVINKLKAGEIEKASINNIMLTKKSAVYENISIEGDNLLDVLYEKLNFGGEFDIYTIIETYTNAFEDIVDAQEVNDATYTFPLVKINGFDVQVTKNKHGARKINGKRINAVEVQQVMYRASCHHNLDEYNLFVRRISKMSIRWHDAIANGLPVKMHSLITREEYDSPEASSAAPPVKFWIDPAAKCIKIRVEGDDGGKVSLGKLITRIDTINKKTNDRWSNKASKTRNWRWAREELARAIRDCCTFTTVTKNEDGTENSITTTTVTSDDIKKIIDVADQAKKQAVERSKNFLDSAVKVTGAEMIEFLGKKAYKVKGSLRTYAIVVENAKVYDFESKQYRCIVNDNHFRGAGYDDIAARLYVLKNDSVMQGKIGTLKGEAQPQYENTHNDYQPDRDDVADIIDQLDLTT